MANNQNIDLEKLRFPIGHFEAPAQYTPSIIAEWIQEIADLPEQLWEATENLSDAELDTPYRPGGWTKRQVVHHLADSHINAYTRFKLAVTEDNPTIKPYLEGKWAEFEDGKTGAIAPSLALLEALHFRWANFLRTLDDAQLQRTFFHPEHQKSFSLAENVGVYAWHGRHHLGHVELDFRSLRS